MTNALALRREEAVKRHEFGLAPVLAGWSSARSPMAGDAAQHRLGVPMRSSQSDAGSVSPVASVPQLHPRTPRPSIGTGTFWRSTLLVQAQQLLAVVVLSIRHPSAAAGSGHRMRAHPSAKTRPAATSSPAVSPWTPKALGSLPLLVRTISASAVGVIAAATSSQPSVV